MPKRLGNPLVRINNEPFPIIANSCKFNEGDGETTVEIQMVGNEPETVESDSGEDKKSMFSFDVMNTEENIKKLRGLKKNTGANVVDMSEDGFKRVFRKASITNNPDVELSATGKISVEWESLPAI